MPSRDEFDDPEGFFARLVTHTGRAAGSVFENRSLMVSGGVFVCVIALSGVIWASYPAQNPLGSDGTVPIIRADAEPYKYVPADRGGMQIPHQDSTIFAALSGEGSKRKVENLLDDGTEQPMDRQQLFAGLKNDLADVTRKNDDTAANDRTQVAGAGNLAEGYESERPMSESERRALAAKRNRDMLNEQASPLPGDMSDSSSRLPSVLKSDEIKPELSADSLQDELAAPAKGVAVEPKPATKIAKKPDAGKKTPLAEIEPASNAVKVTTGTGNVYVQVSSVPDKSKIAPEWKKLTGALPMLTGLDYRVQSADIKGKGTFHRIQVGPMSSADATELCTAIKTKKPGGCIIAR
jgi:hypothetical protein